MHRRSLQVTWKEASNDRLPDRFSEATALILDLDRRGQLEEIGERIRIRREGGYCGFDVLLFLLVYFASAPATGIRKFWDLVRPYQQQLAALAERRKLPSPASLSRALDAVEPALLRPAAEWLLSEGAGVDAVLGHPAMQTYDARGLGWQVFDFDPTVTTLRHRALPEADDLPAARRRSAGMAVPGFSGRKRGDVQFRRGTLQHAGSSAWLQATLAPGNGDGHAELQAALDVVVRTCRRLDHPLERALLRMDGAFGWVPFLSACRAAGVPVLTRLTRYDLLDQPEVQRALRKASWLRVPDSLSGPRRSAIDLGVVTVPPGQDTRRADGTTYDPISVRVVVSRYPRTGEAEHGRVIDGWQYELFAADIPAHAMPAPDVVALYFGRAGQENRFAQEDREVGLDRIFSYHLPGQELAVITGFWVWNLRLVRGLELAPLPAERPTQKAYVAQFDEPHPADPTPSPDPFESQAAAVASPPSVTETAPPSPVTLANSSRPDSEPEGPPDIDPFVAELGRIDWDTILGHRPGWSWDSQTGRLRCPDDRDLVLTTVRPGEHAQGRTGIIFCRPAEGCSSCDGHSTCRHSTRLYRPNHAEFSVPTPVATRLRKLLRTRRRAARRRHGRSQVTPASRPTKWTVTPLSIAPLPLTIPVFAVLSALFLPAAARHLLRSAASTLSFTISVNPPGPRPRLVLLAASDGARQHRRQTWTQHYARNALDPAALVRVEIAGRGLLQEMLTGPRAREAM